MKEEHLSAFHDIVVVGDIAWYYDIYHGAILRFDIEKRKTTLEVIFPDNSGEKLSKLYSSIGYWNNILILVYDNILLYDIERKVFRNVELNLEGWKQEDIYCLFSGLTVYKDCVYFFPGRYHSIVRLNLKTLEVQYFSEWYQELEIYTKDEKKNIFWGKHEEENLVFLPCWQGGGVMEFDMQTGKHQIYEVIERDLAFSDIEYDGSDFWISVYNQPLILRCNRSFKVLSIYGTFPEEFYSKSGFSYLIDMGDSVCAIPVLGNMMLKIHKKDGRVEEFSALIMKSDLKKARGETINANVFCKKYVLKDKVILYSAMDGNIIFLDKKTGNMQKVKLVISNEKDILRIREATAENFVKSENSVILREKNMCLSEYLESVKKVSRSSSQKIGEKNVGVLIYEQISKKLSANE